MQVFWTLMIIVLFKKFYTKSIFSGKTVKSKNMFLEEIEAKSLKRSFELDKKED